MENENSEFSLIVYGTRGSLPAPSNRDFDSHEFGGSTTCYLIKYKDHLIAVDTGSGAMRLGDDLMRQYEAFRTGNGKLVIAHTHGHWDHIQGFPFFVPAYIKGNQIAIYGNPKKVMTSQLGDSVKHSDVPLVRGVHEIQMNPENGVFPVALKWLQSQIAFPESLDGLRTAVPGVEIAYKKVNHPQECYSYKFTVGEGKDRRTLVVLTDHEHDPELDRLTDYDKEIAEWLGDAHVIVMDGQYTPEEYARTKGFGHCVGQKAVLMVEEAMHYDADKKLYIGHHDPRHDDEFLRRYETDLQEQARDRGLDKNLSVCLLKELDEIKL